MANRTSVSGVAFQPRPRAHEHAAVTGQRGTTMSTVDATTPARRRMILWLALLVGLITPAVAFSMAADAALPGHLSPPAGEFTSFQIDGDMAGPKR